MSEPQAIDQTEEDGHLRLLLIDEVYSGHPVILIRHHIGGAKMIWVCGYIGFNPSSFYFGTEPNMGYGILGWPSSCNEITYARQRNPWTIEDDGYWWLGYDTNHYCNTIADAELEPNRQALMLSACILSKQGNLETCWRD